MVTKIIEELIKNRSVFRELLSGLHEEMYLWKPSPEKWCLLEIICHLNYIEIDDFRTRVHHILETPSQQLPPVDPQGWVKTRNYLRQNFNDKLNEFLDARKQSIQWLQHLSNPKWDQFYEHPKLGNITARMLLVNWLAHDYLHIRQITRLKYNYLEQWTKEDLSYAGTW